MNGNPNYTQKADLTYQMTTTDNRPEYTQINTYQQPAYTATNIGATNLPYTGLSDDYLKRDFKID